MACFSTRLQAMTIGTLIASGICGSESVVASTEGSIAADFSGFLRSTPLRSESYTSMELGLRTRGESKLLRTKLDLRAYVLANDLGGSITPEIPEVYVGTNDTFSRLHGIQFGRVKRDWSRVDEAWTSGFWEPRFTWDPIRPYSVGLFGLHYQYQSKQWLFRAVASPLAVPERGMPISTEDGKVQSPGPWLPPVYEETIVGNNVFPIRYDIKYPDFSNILFRPGLAVQLRYGEEKGYWISGAYGNLPVNALTLAAEATIEPQQDYVTANLHPVFHRHHIAQLESGYQEEMGAVWASAAFEAIEKADVPSTWVQNGVGNARVLSAGIDLKWIKYLAFNMSYIYVDEKKPARPDDQLFEIPLPGRFPYERAAQIGAHWRANDFLDYKLKWLSDLQNSNGVVSLDMEYRPRSRRWSVGLGADLVRVEKRVGWTGQFMGNDRVRGRLSYVF